MAVNVLIYKPYNYECTEQAEICLKSLKNYSEDTARSKDVEPRTGYEDLFRIYGQCSALASLIVLRTSH